ncbi:MAG: histone deacetylase [Thermodesulfobacteriota bacterium]
MHKTGVVRDDRYLNHRTSPGHPENHRRLEAIYAVLESSDLSDRLENILPRAADKKEIELIHSPEYLKRIAQTAEREFSYLTPDTNTSSGSYLAALLAAGGLLEAIDKVNSGELNNAMALVRPPGHHAEKGRAMGFCLFNNVAIGAKFARRVLGLDRVLIVDWDVHHGNGTQHSFENDPSVLFFSVHQYPLYPGTGLFTEVGIGKGEGFTMNLPLPKGYGDGEYAAIFETLLKPAALEFNPDIILVSAGFDAHFSDPLGGMRLSSAGYAALTRSLMDIASACCSGKLVLTLEGGYHLGALEASIRSVLLELSESSQTDIRHMAGESDSKKLDYAVSRFTHVHRPFWKSL